MVEIIYVVLLITFQLFLFLILKLYPIFLKKFYSFLWGQEVMEMEEMQSD